MHIGCFPLKNVTSICCHVVTLALLVLSWVQCNSAVCDGLNDARLPLAPEGGTANHAKIVGEASSCFRKRYRGQILSWLEGCRVVTSRGQAGHRYSSSGGHACCQERVAASEPLGCYAAIVRSSPINWIYVWRSVL